MTVGERSTGTPKGRVQVLLVEDDLAEVRLLEASMRDRGTGLPHSDVATTMADAIAMLHATPFDVVLLDLSLPDSQGLSTVTTLLEAHPSVPVVVLTGTEDDQLTAAAIEAGAQDYLVKGSVTPEVLVRVIHHAREHHGMLAALQLREHRFRTMAESAQDAIYRFRIRPTCEFEYLNPAVARLSGFPLGEFHADPDLCLQRVHREDRWKLDMDELDPAGTAPSVMVRFRRANGEWIALEVHRTPIVEDGVVVGVQGVVRDVTAQQRTTKALHDALWAEQRAAEQLRATNDLKGQFLQAVSHELRTPLTSIIGFSETLVDSIDHLAPDQVRTFHERILDNAQRLRLLMGDLLDLEQLTQAELETSRTETDVTGLAGQVARSLSTGTRNVVVEDAPCVASVDAGMVERILRNLLANTVKHTPPTTTVTVRCTRDDDVARISVIDDGPGIPQDCREEAFEPFWQGTDMQDAPSPGTGVGLAVVRQFAALHDGHAWLEATPGGGLTVHVELAARSAAEVGDPQPADRPAVLGRTPPPDEASWRYLAVEHRRSLQQAMANNQSRRALAGQGTDGPPSGADDQDTEAVDGPTAVLWATRELLAAGTIEELVGIVLRAVHTLGGTVLPARLEDAHALPLDLTLGHGEPLLPVADPASAARTLLQRHLPGLVADARDAADRLRAQDHADADPTLGLAGRQELHRLLARMRDDDVLATVDLQGLHESAREGPNSERTVRCFVSCLREQIRAGDHVARVGHDEFALLLRGTGRAGALEALERLRARWEQLRPHPVIFSTGIALGSEHDPQVLRNVELALYLARSAGAGAQLQEVA